MVYFKKTYPEPPSLAIERVKPNGSYKKQDVLDQLCDEFHNKCYICESKDIENINIEHFAPHKDISIIKKYNWGNLFWSCGHCNTIKSSTHVDLLNCLVMNDKVDVNIKYDVDDNLKGNKIIIEALSSDKETLNTVELLTKVYNGTTSQNKFQARVKRDHIYDELCNFTNYISKYIRLEDDKKKKKLLIAIENDLSNDSPFTAFKRYYIRNNLKLSCFKQYITN